jgi:hydroxyacylglutathione hydrolase
MNPVALHLVAISAFNDNYIWMLHDGVQALVVDPGDAAPVLQTLRSLSLRLAGILVTHHHADHVGGLAELRPLLQGQVWGPAGEAIPGPYEPLSGGASLTLLGQHLRVLDVPGHTAGHIAFVLDAPSDGSAPLLFCGDTLFSGGCGRLFEGSPAQMLASLQQLAALPGHTRVCCAHEYTLSNLRFARTIEPANPALQQYQAWCEAQRAAGLPTLPSTLARELEINPFLRCTAVDVIASAMQWRSEHQQVPIAADGSPLAVFASLRQWKNDYR